MDTFDIILLEAGSLDLISLYEAASRADAQGRTFRITTQNGQLKYKVGEGMWTAPTYSHRENGGY